MVEVREPQRVAEEEDRRVVADDVPVALLGIELEGGAADVAFRIGRAALAGDGREAREHGRLLPALRGNLGLGVAGDGLVPRKWPPAPAPLAVPGRFLV